MTLVGTTNPAATGRAEVLAMTLRSTWKLVGDSSLREFFTSLWVSFVLWAFLSGGLLVLYIIWLFLGDSIGGGSGISSTAQWLFGIFVLVAVVWMWRDLKEGILVAIKEAAWKEFLRTKWLVKFILALVLGVVMGLSLRIISQYSGWLAGWFAITVFCSLSFIQLLLTQAEKRIPFDAEELPFPEPGWEKIPIGPRTLKKYMNIFLYVANIQRPPYRNYQEQPNNVKNQEATREESP